MSDSNNDDVVVTSLPVQPVNLPVNTPMQPVTIFGLRFELVNATSVGETRTSYVTSVKNSSYLKSFAKILLSIFSNKRLKTERCPNSSEYNNMKVIFTP